jgi:hypothetical protein
LLRVEQAAWRVRDHRRPMHDSPEERQDHRAVQYAVCTYALEHDRVTDGAEGIFDQALTNGLAAIVARAWPGAELKRSLVWSARELLDVIEQRGTRDRDGSVRVLHDPDGPEFEEVLFSDEPLPNFTTVRVPCYGTRSTRRRRFVMPASMVTAARQR